MINLEPRLNTIYVGANVFAQMLKDIPARPLGDKTYFAGINIIRIKALEPNAMVTSDPILVKLIRELKVAD